MVSLSMLSTRSLCCLLVALPAPAADLVVDGETVVITENLTVDGEVVIQNAGTLRIEGATLTLNLDFDEQHHIDISDTSRLEVVDATIRTEGDYQYWIELTDQAAMAVSGNSLITFHSGIRPFDDATVTVTGGNVEELQARDRTVVSVTNAAVYPVYFFEGVTANLTNLFASDDTPCAGTEVSSTVTVPNGWRFTITDSCVEGYQIDLKQGADVSLANSDGIVLSIHTPGTLGPELQIAENLTSSMRASGSSTNLGNSFTFTDSNIALINVYTFGRDRVWLRDMHVNEVNAQAFSELLIGDFGVTTTLNCNLCQVYDSASFTVVNATIDDQFNVASATSAFGDLQPVGRGTMRFADTQALNLQLSLVEQGTLVMDASPYTPANLQNNNPGQTTFIDDPHFGADFTADVTAGDPPLSVDFIDLSAGNILDCSYDFGDGGTSTDCNPTHIYTQPGVYTVDLDVVGAVPGGVDGDEERKIGFIRVGVLFTDGFELAGAATR